MSLANGEFALLDLQLNDELTEEDLNERVYTHELEIMEQLTDNPTYGEAEEFTMHITKDDEGEYAFSQEDLDSIHDSVYLRDRHWTKEKAKKVVETLLGAIYNEKYTELAEVSFATEDEIRDIFGIPYSPDQEKKSSEDRVNDILRGEGMDESYSMSEELAKDLSKAENDLLHSTNIIMQGLCLN